MSRMEKLGDQEASVQDTNQPVTTFLAPLLSLRGISQGKEGHPNLLSLGLLCPQHLDHVTGPSVLPPVMGNVPVFAVRMLHPHPHACHSVLNRP